MVKKKIGIDAVKRYSIGIEARVSCVIGTNEHMLAQTDQKSAPKWLHNVHEEVTLVTLRHSESAHWETVNKLRLAMLLLRWCWGRHIRAQSSAEQNIRLCGKEFYTMWKMRNHLNCGQLGLLES